MKELEAALKLPGVKSAMTAREAEAGGLIENKHSTDVESHRVCIWRVNLKRALEAISLSERSEEGGCMVHWA
jgi:hypothetical protein